MVVVLVSEQHDHTDGYRPHRHRRGAAVPFRRGDALSVRSVGRTLSLDRVGAVRAAKRQDLAARPPPAATPWTGACIRLMQIQMVVLFFFSGIEKVRWDEWWGGDAIWLAFTTYEFYNPRLLD